MPAQRGIGLIILVVLAGLVVGSLLGELLGSLLPAGNARELMTRGPMIGLMPPATVDLRFLAMTIGVGVVLGADTVVVVDGVVLGKPSGPEEARGMLVRLRGRWHEVITGVAVVDAGTERGASATAVSRVLMADYSDATVEEYVASG